MAAARLPQGQRAGNWDHACSGHMSVGEEPEQAAVRELAEELGVVVAAAALELVDRQLVSLGSETELTGSSARATTGRFASCCPRWRGSRSSHRASGPRRCPPRAPG